MQKYSRTTNDGIIFDGSRDGTINPLSKYWSSLTVVTVYRNRKSKKNIIVFTPQNFCYR